MEEVTFLVDTRVFYMTIPSTLAEKPRIEDLEKTELKLADIEALKRDHNRLHKAYGRGRDTPSSDNGLAHTVARRNRIRRLKVEPATGKHEHARPYGLASI